MCCTYARSEEKVDVFVQQSLILTISQAKVLQELVSQSHKVVHSNILLLVVRDLQQIQQNGMHAHVPQQALLVLSRLDAGGGGEALLLHAQPVHPLQDLLDHLVVSLLCAFQGRPDVQVDGRGLFIGSV